MPHSIVRLPFTVIAVDVSMVNRPITNAFLADAIVVSSSTACPLVRNTALSTVVFVGSETVSL